MSRNLVKLSIACLLMIGLASASWAGGDNNANRLVGTWKATFNDDDTLQIVSTFHRDGTYINTSSSNLFTNAQGVWEKVGPRTYVERSRSFQVGADGAILFILDNREVIELSQDGQSYTSQVETEVREPDGDLLFTVTGTTAATRMTVDF